MIGTALLLIAGFSLEPASGFFYQFASEEACKRAKVSRMEIIRELHPQREWFPACAKVKASGKAFVLLRPSNADAPGVFIQVKDMDLCAEFKPEALAMTRKSFPRTVYAKAPFGDPAQVLNYPGRYTHRVAIANSRLVSVTDHDVAFRWPDYCQHGKAKIMTLKAHEFIRRFLLHALPDGFHTVHSASPPVSSFDYAGTRMQCRVPLFLLTPSLECAYPLTVVTSLTELAGFAASPVACSVAISGALPWFPQTGT